jgi:hypothetical protein
MTKDDRGFAAYRDAYDALQRGAQFPCPLEQIATDHGVPLDRIKWIAERLLDYLHYDTKSETVSPAGRDDIIVELMRESRNRLPGSQAWTPRGL